MKDSEEKMYDTRVLDRRLKKGTITQKDYEAYLKSIKDSKDNVEYIQVFQEPSEEDAAKIR